ncbi:MAG: hypothetical protein ABSD56_14975 [Bryobacteraceae bacterium]
MIQALIVIVGVYVVFRAVELLCTRERHAAGARWLVIVMAVGTIALTLFLLVDVVLTSESAKPSPAVGARSDECPPGKVRRPDLNGDVYCQTPTGEPLYDVYYRGGAMDPGVTGEYIRRSRKQPEQIESVRLLGTNRMLNRADIKYLCATGVLPGFP